MFSRFKTKHIENFLLSRPDKIGTQLFFYIGIFICTLFILMMGISTPASLNFDEAHYVPAARKIVAGNSPGNFEHPPLGKLLIAASIKIVGDTPSGWRAFSAIFGALAAIGIFALGLLLFKNYLGALCVLFITLTNQFLFVQARVAMLDQFMVTFLIGAIFFAVWAFSNSRETRALPSLYLSGALLGLATACKWLVLIYILPLWVYFILFWRSSLPFKRGTLIGAWVGTSVLCYLLTFLPYLFLVFPEGQQPSLWSVISDYQLRLWTEQKLVTQSHPYESAWFTWPSMARPIWYFYEKGEVADTVRGIVLLGNPLILWTGFLIFLWQFHQIIFRSLSPLRNFLVAAFALSWLSWFVIPRKVTFFFYYYPAVLILGFLLTLTFQEFLQKYPHRQKLILLLHLIFLTLCSVLCFYFFPILSAQEIPTDSLYHRMWFTSWI